MTARTIPEQLFETARREGSRPAYHVKRDGIWRATSWATYADEIKAAAKALIALGLERGGKVAILGFNRPEWVIFDRGRDGGGRRARRHLHDVLGRGGAVHRPPHRVAGRARRERRASCAKVKAKREQAAAAASTS